MSEIFKSRESLREKIGIPQMQRAGTLKMLNESTSNQGFTQYPNQFPFNAVNAIDQAGIMNVSALDESIMNLT